MLSIQDGYRNRNCQGMTRRTAMRIGALGGLSFPWLLEQRAEAASDGLGLRDTSVVLLTLNGGPSQFETFDPKMDAPSEIRSVTGEIKTKLPGVTFGGTFPRLAALADKLSIVRSFGTYNSGHDLSKLTRAWSVPGGNDAPSWGSVYSRIAGPISPQGIPSYGLINSIVFDPQLKKARASEFTNTFVKAAQPGILGPGSAPFYPAGGGPLMENMKLRSPAGRFDDRRTLLMQLDRLRRSIDATGELDKADTYRQRAYDIITRGAVTAFDLEQEDAATMAMYDTSEQHIKNYRRDPGQLDNYTPKFLGKQMLLARRLCEAGCGFVMVDCFGWDMHGEKIGDQFGMYEGMQALGWAVDKAVSGFIQDCEQRGLNRKIMLVVTGELGRTPKINDRGGGRDHWAEITPLLIYGGGLQMGKVVGASDRQGGSPVTTPYNTNHLAATIMHVLVDGGQVRLRQDLPKEVVRLASAGTPIEPLL